MSGAPGTAPVYRLGPPAVSAGILPFVHVRQLSPAEAGEAMAAGAVAVDVREPDEWAAGHLDASRHMPLSELAERLGELPQDAPILFVCRSGSRSDLAAHALARTGRTDLLNLSGGLRAWAADGRPLAPEGAGVVI
jgi:rhodanese-related sulfurtransferase